MTSPRARKLAKKRKIKPVHAYGFLDVRCPEDGLFGAPVWIEFYREMADARVRATNRRLGYRAIKVVRVVITQERGK